jgi:nitroreductase
MNLAELIRNRRTVQTFSSEPVSQEAVKQALELSLWSLNHRLTFPWVYKIASPAEREKLADLAVELKSKKGPASDTVRASMRANFLNPAYYVALGLKKESDPVIDKENFATLAASVQIASLVLWEQGIGSKWTTSGFSTHGRTYEILGISADEVRLEGGLMIGKAAHPPTEQKRPSLDEVLL